MYMYSIMFYGSVNKCIHIHTFSLNYNISGSVQKKSLCATGFNYINFKSKRTRVNVHTHIPCTHQYNLRGKNCVRTTNAVRYRVTLFFLDCMYRQCKQSTCPFFQQVDLLNHDENLHQTHTLNPRLIFYY